SPRNHAASDGMGAMTVAKDPPRASPTLIAHLSRVTPPGLARTRKRQHTRARPEHTALGYALQYALSGRWYGRCHACRARRARERYWADPAEREAQKARVRCSRQRRKAAAATSE